MLMLAQAATVQICQQQHYGLSVQCQNTVRRGLPGLITITFIIPTQQLLNAT